MKKIFLIQFVILTLHITAQTLNTRFKDGLKIYLNDDSTRYIKATGLAQIWVRYNDNNPGSAIYGTQKKETFDVGLRRVRYQIMSQVSKKIFMYTQVGVNSINNLSARKTGLFFHDVTAEYSAYKNYLTIGAGLHGWNGTARYTSSGVGNILALDLPIVEEATNDVSDQFVRKLGVYAKGKINRLDYRFAASNPFPVQNAITPTTTLSGTGTAYYSPKAPEMQYQSYLFWQFLDKEANLVPYMTGSYLGKKRIFNIGSGFAYQKNAMWYSNSNNDTLFKPMQQFGVDVFFDYYLNKENQNAITAYASIINYNFGPNYLRNVAIMNTANSTIGANSNNGAGNAIPLIGTGNVLYLQAAYLFKKDLLKFQSTLQPYASAVYAQYQKLSDPMLVYNLGVNWIISGQNAKLSLDYQSRPIFNADVNGNLHETKSARRGQVVVQYQVAF